MPTFGAAIVTVAVAVTAGPGVTNTVTAIRTSITVNNVSEYQWAAVLSLPAAGTYCYRVFLGATDLLARAFGTPVALQDVS